MKRLKNPRSKKQVYKILEDNIELLIEVATDSLCINVSTIQNNIENQFKGYDYHFDSIGTIEEDIPFENLLEGDFYVDSFDIEESLDIIYSKLTEPRYMWKKDLLKEACQIISNLDWSCPYALSDENSLDILPLIIRYDATYYTDIILPKYWLVDTYIYSLNIDKLNELSYNEIIIDYKLQHDILTSGMTFSEYFNSDNFKYWLEGVLYNEK